MYVRGLMTALKSPRKRAGYQLFKAARSFVELHFHYLAVRTGLADALKTSASREALHCRLSVARPEFLDSLLDLGLSVGALSLRDGMYEARSPLLRGLISEDGDGMAALVEAFVTYYNSIYRRFPDRLTGAPLSDELSEIGVVVARASRIIEPYVMTFIEKIMPRGRTKILDVGCGSAGYLHEAAKVNPEAVGVGLERDPEVADLARKNLESWDLAGRFRVQTSDLRNWTEAAEFDYDLVFFFNSIYYFPPEERVGIYRLLHDRLKETGSLVVINQFQGRGADCFAANLNAATCSLKGCWPLPDLAATRERLETAGFSRVRPARLMPGSSFYGLTARA